MIQTIIKTQSILFVILILFSACGGDLSDIEIKDLPRTNEQYVNITIQGKITSELDYHTVMLTESVYITDSVQYVSDAKVELHVGNTIYEYIESLYHPNYPKDKQKKGLYVSTDKIKGIVGKTHTLQVTYNNILYTASDSMIAVNPFNFNGNNVPQAKEYSWSSGGSSVKDTSLFFGGVFFLQNESYILEWGIPLLDYFTEKMYRYYRNSYYFNSIENPEINNNSKHILLSFPEGEMLDSTVITKKYSISKEYQDFLIQSFKILFFNSTRFSSTPANVVGNISNGGYGFFAACDVYTDSIVYKDLYEIAVKNDL